MKKIILIVLFPLVLILEACNPEDNYNIWSLFFDGVPKPESNNYVSNTVVLDSAKIKKHVKLLIKTQAKFVIHEPYKQRKCDKCHNHDVSQGFSLIKKPPELCYGCHKKLVKNFTYIHGPFDAGYCTKCHQPHKSLNKFMLLKSGQGLCLQCHVLSDIKKNKKHPEFGSKDCLMCHNPHGSQTKYLLRKK